MSKPEPAETDEVSLALIERDAAGERARIRGIARKGLPPMRKVSEINIHRKRAAQYRACVALGWDSEQILFETSWPLTRLMAVRNYVEDEDKRLYEKKDPAQIFAVYTRQQQLCMKELEDLAMVFKKSKQFSSLVNAVKTRSDILERVVKMGQELGIIKRTPREVNISGKVDLNDMSAAQLRVYVKDEMRQMSAMLEIPLNKAEGPAGAVLEKILRPTAIPATAKRVAKPRVRKLASAG